MTRLDTELIGLQIVAADDASVVGEVDGLLIDDLALKVAGFLVGLGLFEASVLPFGSVRAVGNDAIIVASATSLIPIKEHAALETLARKEITVSDAKAITAAGRSVGTIGDFYVDTESGEIVGLEFVASDQSVYPRGTAIIPASTIHRLGRDIVVLENDYDTHLLRDAGSLDRLGRTRTEVATPVFEPGGGGDSGPVAASEESGGTETLETRDKEVEFEQAWRTIAAGPPATPTEVSAELEETVTEEPAPEAGPAAIDADEAADERREPARAEAETSEPEAAAPERAPIQSEFDLAEDAVTPEVEAAPESEPVTEREPAPTGPGEDDAVTSQQKHFLIGKRVLRRIDGPTGEVIAQEGDLVTFEMIQKAKSSDQLLILSLNVE